MTKREIKKMQKLEARAWLDYQMSVFHDYDDKQIEAKRSFWAGINKVMHELKIKTDHSLPENVEANNLKRLVFTQKINL